MHRPIRKDAHEFFGFVLNEMADSLVARKKKDQQACERESSSQQSGAHQSQHLDKHCNHSKHYGPVVLAGHQKPPQYMYNRPSRDRDRLKLPGGKGNFGIGMKNGFAASRTRGGLGVPRFAPNAAQKWEKGTCIRSQPLATTVNRDSVGHAFSASSRGGTEGKGQRDGVQRNGDGSGETWVHRIFQGVLTKQTKCLCCETVSNRDEPFMDLSLDVEQNSSVAGFLCSLRHTETLTKNKLFCKSCHALQEAEKTTHFKRLPPVLTLHLKRFKYAESLDSFSKLSHRVVFSPELRIPNVTDGQSEADADGRLYRIRVGHSECDQSLARSTCHPDINGNATSLFAVVAHIGPGPNHGHYVALVESGGRWLRFDDDVVELVDVQVLIQCFGKAQPASTSATATNTGYLLLYTSCDDESCDDAKF